MIENLVNIFIKTLNYSKNSLHMFEASKSLRRKDILMLINRFRNVLEIALKYSILNKILAL